MKKILFTVVLSASLVGCASAPRQDNLEVLKNEIIAESDALVADYNAGKVNDEEYKVRFEMFKSKLNLFERLYATRNVVAEDYGGAALMNYGAQMMQPYGGYGYGYSQPARMQTTCIQQGPWLQCN